MQEINFDDFHITANMETVSISRDEGSISFRPGEAERMTALIGIALRMESLIALPSHISNFPFKVVFNEDDSLEITREDMNKGLKLSWSEVDRFIQIVGEAVKISINDSTLNSSPNRHSATGSPDPDTPYID